METNDRGTASHPDAPAVGSAPRVGRRRTITRRGLVLGVALGAAMAIAASTSWWYSCGFAGCPTPRQLQAWQPTEGGALLDRDGELVAPLVPLRRVNVPLSQIPPMVQAAFIAVEDRRFHTHSGVDWHGVARAAVANVRSVRVRQGASTITMQLARNVFLSHRASERTVARKLLEWRYAQLIERALDKPAILERYLNAIYLGNGVYGVEGASQDLFGKSVANLTLAEAALLAGLPKAPSSYTPRRDRARAKQRRAVVLAVLEREQVASARQVAAAHATPVRTPPATAWRPKHADSWAVEVVRTTLDSLRRAGAIPRGLADAQLHVHGTFDRRAQLAAIRAIAQGASQVDRERGGALPRTQGALVAIDPATGAIRAIVGGRTIERRGFNRALRAHRQPGSAFKPFVYAAALQQGFTTATMVDDAPVTVTDGGTIWTPANYNGDYVGRVTVRDALARSSNAATVRISRQVGIPRVAAMAKALGITSSLPAVPSLALGAGAVTPIELTAAYAAFGNGGMRVQPYAIERIENQFGDTLWTRRPAASVLAIDPRDAFLVTSLLRSVVDEGTGRAVRQGGIRGPVAGKTGTTNDGADIWFVGYTPTLVSTVWFGTDEPRSLGAAASGGRLAAPVWTRFMRDGWHSPAKDTEWPAPEGLVAASIDIGTGKLAGEWCGPSRREWFRTGTAPTARCEGEMQFARWEASPRQRAPRMRIEGWEEAIEAMAAVTDRRARRLARQVIEELRRAERERMRMEERVRERERQWHRGKR